MSTLRTSRHPYKVHYNRRCFLGDFRVFGLVVQTSSRRKRLDFLSNSSFMEKSDKFVLQRRTSGRYPVKRRGARKHSRIISYAPVPTISGISGKTASIVTGLTVSTCGWTVNRLVFFERGAGGRLFRRRDENLQGNERSTRTPGVITARI